MIRVKIENSASGDYRSDEAMKELRTNVLFSGSENKVIAFSSCYPNEGKSTVALNFALSMAQDGKKVLFIDADLRKSVIIGRYKLARDYKGLSHFLSGMSTFDEVIYGVENSSLHVVFAGPVPPNPAELLGNKYFETLIKQLRNVYDYVIIDTPPMEAVVDALIIARKCDSVVLVTSVASTSYKIVNNVKESFERNQIKILGIVLNKVPTDKKGYGYYKYGKYGKYGRYSHYGRYGKYGKYEKYAPYGDAADVIEK